MEDIFTLLPMYNNYFSNIYIYIVTMVTLFIIFSIEFSVINCSFPIRLRQKKSHLESTIIVHLQRIC